MKKGDSIEVLGEQMEIKDIENDKCTLVATKDNKTMQLQVDDLKKLAR